MNATRLLALALLIGLAGCADDDPDMVVIEAEGDGMAMEPAPMPAAGMDQPPGGLGETLQLQPLRDSGVRGEVTIADRGQQTEIMVRLTGASANGQHPGHIHSGSCDAPGGVVQALEPISTDATGTGTMTTNVELAPQMVMDGQHIVVYHGTGGAPATCAGIPALVAG